MKEYLEFSKLAFQEVARLVGRPNRHILEILLARRHTLVTQIRRARVRLHHCYINLLYAHVWNAVVMSVLMLLVAT